MVVVGAGPAGCAAAITLARLGRRVTLVDKATFPREKCCGDGLTAAALRRLEELGLDPSSVPSWEPVREVMVVSPTGRQVELPLHSPGVLAVSATRSDLDAAMVSLARSEGVSFQEGVAVSAVAPSGSGVAVDLADGTSLHTHYVIACDGMWSPVRRHLGLTPPGYLGEWQAGRQYLKNTGPLARKLWVWFEPDMMPGYAWSFPLPDGRVNVGYGVLRNFGHAPDLKGQMIDWAGRPHIAEVLGPDATPDGPWRAWPIPTRIGSAALSALDGRVLFAGDAAGACDSMTGEGVAQALETGSEAARAVAGAGPDAPPLAARRYARVIKWGMALDDRLAWKLSSVLARRSGPDKAMAIADATDWGRRYFARWMFEDYPRAALATPHRWRRHMFNTPGAYAGRF